MKIDVKIKIYNHNFRRQRIKMGYVPMRALSDITGYSLGWLYEVEGLKRFPSIEKANKLSSILECDIDYLFPEVSKKIAQHMKELKQEAFWLIKETMPLIKDDLTPAINKCLENLNERERRIINLRYGIGDDYPRSLGEVGSLFNFTRERVRQIEANAIKKMRHSNIDINDI